jgi:porphobilinogen synthase
MRRLRQFSWLRDLVAETVVLPQHLILPIFVRPRHITASIATLPGIQRYTLEELPHVATHAASLGIKMVALFPVVEPHERTEDASKAFDGQNLMCMAIRCLKQHVPEIGIMADVALDPYTLTGHDGLCEGETVLNDETISVLCKQAVIQAQVGADVLAPSDMMDGRIGAIRQALDRRGFEDRLVLSYAAKYASSFYGPFREAIGTNISLGKRDKRTYQMDPRNAEEAMLEAILDHQEGADIILIKPGLAYLDILHRVHKLVAKPTFVYQVSGEYAMIRAAANLGCIDYESTLMETLIAFRRAGAQAIVTYAALEAATLLKNQ